MLNHQQKDFISTPFLTHSSPTVRPAPAYLVEKLDSMLEAADVLKQSGKEFLSAVPKDHKMFEATVQVMNHIYWVNASLKSLSPVNGMV